MAAFSFDSSAGRFTRFVGRLSKSRFFVISVALHFVLVITGGSVVLFKTVIKPNDVVESDGPLVAQTTAPPPPAVEALPQPTDPTVQDVAKVNVQTTNMQALTSLNTNAAFSLPSEFTNLPTPESNRFTDLAPTTPTAAAPPKVGEIPKMIAQQMKGFQQGWAKPGEAGTGVSKSRSFKFTAFLAKYAGGDWDSTIQVDKAGKVSKGSLPNLLYIMRKLSHDKIDADPDPVPLDLASDDIFAKKPPFILFTGHRDFVLTDKEVDNLRKYLQLGGCIWGDSSLPGNRSRFDLAFRREMKRILSDQDINWEALPKDHPIYTKNYWQEIRETPAGLNYYQEPVYALKNYGEVSVIYTANDYCDMWQIALTEKLEYDLRQDEHNDWIVMNYPMYVKRNLYFRNLGLPSVITGYKFGTNIVVHLLTRWEDKLRNVPTGL